jgi:eukaryotic-like serine/threonine-protein kinase
MAPEHARGAIIDIRSDLYSVGAIMYEALAGRPPFAGDNYNALLFAIQQGTPSPLGELRSDVEPELVDVVMQAMATDANLRFQSAEEMAQALAPWLPETHSSAPPESSASVYAPTIMPPSRS